MLFELTSVTRNGAESSKKDTFRLKDAYGALVLVFRLRHPKRPVVCLGRRPKNCPCHRRVGNMTTSCNLFLPPLVAWRMLTARRTMVVPTACACQTSISRRLISW